MTVISLCRQLERQAYIAYEGLYHPLKGRSGLPGAYHRVLVKLECQSKTLVKLSQGSKIDSITVMRTRISLNEAHEALK